MKIALLTLGTRGDVQPFAVLGGALKKRGHEVTLSTAKNFESLASSLNIGFDPVDADFQSFLESEEGKKMMKNPFQAQKNLEKWVHPLIYESLNTFYKLSLKSDAVLFHGKTLADRFADHVPGKLMMTNVIPAFEPTGEFVNPVFSALPIPAIFNKMSYKLNDLGLRMIRKPIEQFRNNVGLNAKQSKVSLPSIYGISEHFLRKPSDYPAESYYTGFWMASSSQPLDEELAIFCRSGEPPLLITFGSMPFSSKFSLVDAVMRITRELRCRVIVVKGWGITDTTLLEGNPDVKVITNVPYDILFPHVRAVVHHGGIGTIASCLYAGKPFLTCPVLFPMGDQHFWGTIGYQKKVALKPAPLKKMTEDDLVEKVKQLISGRALYDSAAELMLTLKQENGIEKAISIIENYQWGRT